MLFLKDLLFNAKNNMTSIPFRDNKYRDHMLQITRERFLRGKQDSNGMYWFSALDFLNYLFGESEASLHGRVVWQDINDNESAHYSYYNVFYDVLWFCDDELGQNIIHNRTPCMPILSLYNLLYVLDEKGYSKRMNALHRKTVERCLRRCLAGHYDMCKDVFQHRDGTVCDCLPYLQTVEEVLGYKHNNKRKGQLCENASRQLKRVCA